MQRSKSIFRAGLCILTMAFGTSAFAANRPMTIEGSTSQPIGHYDFCKRNAEDCSPNAEIGVAKLTKAAWEKMVEVNETVNVAVFPRTDEEMHGVAEFWSYPTAEGDCEDYVLLKQYMLERAGFLRSALLITVVRQPSGDGHAVLTVRTDKGDFILDNLEEGILDWKQTQYRYLKRQSEKNSAKWVGISDDRGVLVGSVR